MTLSSADLSSMREAIEELLPDTCSIMSITRTSDGQGGWSEAWGTAVGGTAVACRLDYVSGRTEFTGGAIQPYTGFVMTLPYNATVTTANRLIHNGKTYSITGLDTYKSWALDTRCKVERVE